MPLIDVRGHGLGEPAEKWFLITPSDTAELAYITRAVRAGGAGDLAAQREDGTVVTIPSMLAGETIAIRAHRIYSTNTTATSILGLT